jgi:hypothetical protein
MQMHINIARRAKLTRINRGVRFLVAAWIVLSLVLLVLSVGRQSNSVPARALRTEESKNHTNLTTPPASLSLSSTA